MDRFGRGAYPFGVTWIEAEGAYNFSLYSKHARSRFFSIPIYSEPDFVHPLFQYRFDPL